MNKSPSLRFDGFRDDWDRHKLGELAIFNPKSELPDEFEYVDLESVVGCEMLSHRTESKRTAPSRAQRLAQYGDLFFQIVRPYQKNNYLFDKTDKTYVFSTGYAQMRPLVDGQFLLGLVQNEQFVSVVIKYCTGTSYPAISSNDLAEIEIYSSNDTTEQKQIGDYLKQIDCLITFHQQKHSKLLSTKMAMLLKLFPAKDENAPELRFEGFYGAWEWRKLSEMLFPYSDPVPTPREGYERLGIRSYGKGTFYSFVEPGHELGTAQMHRVAADKLIVNITFAWEHAVAVTEESDAGKLVSHRFPQFSLSEDLCPQFLRYLILDERFRHHLLLASPGGAGRNRVLKVDEMLEYRVCVPEYREQKQIADFLNSLEDLIQFHAMQIEKLKNIKAACLEGMFV